MDEESLFLNLRTFDSFCHTCAQFVTLNRKIILTVVTEHGLHQLGLDKNMCLKYVTDVHTNPGRLNCVTCSTQRNQRIMRITFVLVVCVTKFSADNFMIPRSYKA